jgi:hypothetical protein
VTLIREPDIPCSVTASFTCVLFHTSGALSSDVFGAAGEVEHAARLLAAYK